MFNLLCGSAQRRHLQSPRLQRYPLNSRRLPQPRGALALSLLYKPDWDETKERYLAWWDGEAIGRCAMSVTAPRADAPQAPAPEPKDPISKWTDLDYICRANQYRHSRTFYGGEAFPCWHGGYPGNKSVPVFLGCPVTLGPSTGWT